FIAIRRGEFRKPHSPGSGSAQPPSPSGVRSRTLWVVMVPSVLRSGFVWEDLVIGHVIVVHVVAGRTSDDGRTHTQVTDQCCDRDVQHVVPKAAAIGPAPGNSAATKSGLDGAREHVAAKNAQPGEAGIVRICRMVRPAASKADL